MRYKGARDSRLTWIIGIVVVIAVAVAAWFLFIAPA
jgi:hypothetical protein